MIHHKQQQASASSQSGFTIVESLVAILVASLLLAAIAPVIVLSVATRVQAKRIESATDAAKTYLDGVRSGVITAPSSPITDGTTIADYAPPTVGTLTCGTKTSPCTAPATNLYCVSVDGNDCTTTNINNFVIQAIRFNKATVTTGGTTTNITDPAKGYQLGIRVYRASGFSSDGGNLKKAPSKQPTFTGGTGDRKAPLIEMTTEVSTGATFSDFCERLKVTNPQSTCS
ncbi:hormogonium polysaccharide secretion pseudopilin HpsB [Nostoc sp. 106C]|uniref:hormogonium polysaccharide secretion pseudopilin HpsB n=1 Tax=Nostoc sp. 106C TaxID=1932667 RepID=UPI000A38FE45|nr:hormogonium polysaccharide secretion pseudopilin HpsB [Nostoc sp. 106C]OUL19852.1 prepilin-type N-terminal cleavage/methylation domain-containing protein [Nostoc sp. RF31YmG]OUL21855.1 prepilin-type N-terminal cleavage/methylation domain-containing protein [Nostoc sp. 106C]